MRTAPTYRPGGPWRLLFPLLLFVLTWSSCPGQTVAVSANAQYLIGDLSGAFRARTGGEIRTIVGSSGALTSQITNGAPFDVLLSADTSYPMTLWRGGFAADTPRVYAYGVLVLWSTTGVPVARGMRSLLDPSVKRIAVANPRSAPYGAAAIAALRASGLFDTVGAKIVFGESIAQVNQYIDSRTAEVGLTSSSVVLAAPARDAREWALVDTSLYPPIPQAALLVRRGSAADAARAQEFYRFLFTPEARAIFRRYGYRVP